MQLNVSLMEEFLSLKLEYFKYKKVSSQKNRSWIFVRPSLMITNRNLHIYNSFSFYTEVIR